MEERRQVPRHKSLLRGRVYFNNRNSTAECLVRDISAHGARLIFADEVLIPEIVELYIPAKEQMLRAQVIWRNANESGVAFANHQQMARPADAENLADRVQKLEHEIEVLKRFIKRLKAEMPGNDSEAA
jgi:hypothetical protein